MSDTTNATQPAAPAARPVIKVNRRIYAEHKVYGTCITLGAFVYCAPATASAARLTKKDAVKADFTVQGEGYDAVVKDADDNLWYCMGENGGCGPRCPANLKDAYGKAWHSMSFADRKALLAAAQAKPATEAAQAAE